ncbi:hypothetical protein E2C01_005402 [Portunus trituberculatus]|uniref:Uncharacterized protein n=1 Tax=Portunus trituberculatus TaxID=210409 RepID=A0A5B7CTY6_PORTR|nr:hypothetical protein [Portunus trituberculatus]
MLQNAGVRGSDMEEEKGSGTQGSVVGVVCYAVVWVETDEYDYRLAERAGRCRPKCRKMSELKAALEDDSTPSNQDTVSEEDDNLSDLESHTGSERDAASEAGSETPSLSDRSSQRASRSTSNTPTNTRSTRSRDNPDFVAKQKSFMAKVQAATAGSEGVMVRPETPGKRRRDGSAFTSSTKKRKLGKTDNNGQRGDVMIVTSCFKVSNVV